MVVDPHLHPSQCEVDNSEYKESPVKNRSVTKCSFLFWLRIVVGMSANMVVQRVDIW